jgi:hypothetical protein
MEVTRSKVSDRELSGRDQIFVRNKLFHTNVRNKLFHTNVRNKLFHTNVHHFKPRAANGATTYIPWEKSSSRGATTRINPENLNYSTSAGRLQASNYAHLHYQHGGILILNADLIYRLTNSCSYVQRLFGCFKNFITVCLCLKDRVQLVNRGGPMGLRILSSVGSVELLCRFLHFLVFLELDFKT